MGDRPATSIELTVHDSPNTFFRTSAIEFLGTAETTLLYLSPLCAGRASRYLCEQPSRAAVTTSSVRRLSDHGSESRAILGDATTRVRHSDRGQALRHTIVTRPSTSAQVQVWQRPSSGHRQAHVGTEAQAEPAGYCAHSAVS